MSLLPNHHMTVNDASDLYEKIVYEVADAIIAIDEKGFIRLCNPAAERMFGWPPGQLLGRRLDVLLPADIRGRHETYTRDFAEGSVRTRNMGQRHNAIRGVRADGTEIDVWSTILRTRTAAGTILVAVIRDVTDTLTQRRELQRLADTDYLTGTLNRRAFMHVAEQNIALEEAARSPLSIAIFDIDNFKKINDRYGHSAGDAVLIAFVTLLNGLTRGQDVIARWGGEEFILLMPRTDLGAATGVAERICQAVRETRFAIADGHSDLTISVTTSCGVACHAVEPNVMPFLIRYADEALYAAKSGGKDCVRVNRRSHGHQGATEPDKTPS